MSSEEDAPLLRPNYRPIFAAGSTTTNLLLVVSAAILINVTTSPYPKAAYHSLFLSLSDNATAAAHLRALTARPHSAGSPANSAAAAYVASAFSSYSLPVHSARYDVLLSYPLRRSLSLSPTPDGPAAAFDLVQRPYPGDPYADVAAEALPTFHAYAKSGTAAGPAVFANYGRVEDFARLKAMGVNLTGAVAVAKYGKIYRGDIVRNAQDAGAIGAVVYTDPEDYGGGHKNTRWFPEEKWMPPTGVQVGSTYRGVGDPSTPGWPSTVGCERASTEEVAAGGMVPGIPSLPVSSRDGEAITRAIGGPVAPDDWQGRDGAPVYHIGPGPAFLNLSYHVSLNPLGLTFRLVK